ncbi:hypothetical protein ANCCEY_13819 [Ancylostoma ceylanicum]|uniref:EB domain-containing protein n=1 Tax=Ancylostoma ceylanicum TaxID=53326 RepID=A0A0D6L653_9BILA|nr:hypothetical protein ANCCEY_13819 [Ancylostoma ceylanicum]
MCGRVTISALVDRRASRGYAARGNLPAITSHTNIRQNTHAYHVSSKTVQKDTNVCPVLKRECTFAVRRNRLGLLESRRSRHVCTPFRSSDISICCHSSSAFCGPGSSVEMDGLLARDCSKIPCSEGYECSLAPSGSRVCCSLAACYSGQRARAVCAAGCRRDESCEVINGQRWCCPAVAKRCPGNVAGYTCQIASGGLYCCPLDVEIDIVEETTTVPSVSLRKIRPEKPCKECRSKGFLTTPTTTTTTTEQPIPRCPFAFREARIETTDEIKTCIGFLDFSPEGLFVE